MPDKNLPRTLATALLLALAATAQAQPQAQGPGWRPFASATAAYQGGADLDGGGRYEAWSAIVRAGLLGELGGGTRAGVVLNLDRSDYSFTDPAAFGGVRPWSVVQRYGVAAPLSFAWRDGWSLGLTPSVDWFQEKDARGSDALTWGAIASASRSFGGGDRLGFGLGVFDRLEETSVFPLLIVDWRLSDRWRLTNPLPAGPTGPAGLELDVRLDGGWSLGLGAAWRTTRFRLGETGPAANGIGEERGVPVFLRATRPFGAGTMLYLYAGAVTSGRLRVEDASGTLLREVDFGTAPLFGATLSARF